MPRPVCIPCKREMHSSGVGAHIEFTRKQAASAGVLKATKQIDYQVFNADVYKCPDCGAEVAARYGSQPSWQHFQSEPKPQPILVSVREL